MGTIQTETLLLVPQFLLLGGVVFGMVYGAVTLLKIFSSVATTGGD